MIDLSELKEHINNKGKIVLRPSSLQQFISCPMQWFRGALLQDYRRPKSASEAGSSLHKGAEVGYSEKITTGALPPVSVIKDAIRDEWKTRNENEDIEFADGEDYDSVQAELIEDADLYYPTMQVTNPIAVETRYTFDIDHPIFSSVSGSIDIDLQGGLADIKRTNRATTTTKYLLQQSIYAWLKNESGNLCVEAFIHNVVKNKKAEVMSLNLNIEYAKYVVNTILDVTREFWETGNKNLFRGSNPISNYLCSPQWCGYWEKCDAIKHLR